MQEKNLSACSVWASSGIKITPISKLVFLILSRNHFVHLFVEKQYINS